MVGTTELEGTDDPWATKRVGADAVIHMMREALEQFACILSSWPRVDKEQ